MAEFKDIMKKWRRMCGSEDYTGSCNGCPLCGNKVCGNFDVASDADIERAEKGITEWAERNPEKVYPTWKEWLVGIGVVDFKTSIVKIPDYEPIQFSNTSVAYVNEKGNKPIPAEIAEKLGLEPK